MLSRSGGSPVGPNRRNDSSRCTLFEHPTTRLDALILATAAAAMDNRAG